MYVTKDEAANHCVLRAPVASHSLSELGKERACASPDK
jgi:hypothetical protein